MAITILQGEQIRHAGSFQSVAASTQSTATAFVALTVTADATTIGVGTATGFGVNLYSLASATLGGQEGQEYWLYCTGTGEAKVHLAGGTATGLFTFTAANQWLHAKYMDGVWNVISHSATLATST